MYVWRYERARDIFVGGTTPTEWSTMPLEASSVSSVSLQSRPSSSEVADIFPKNSCSRNGRGEWDRSNLDRSGNRSGYGEWDRVTEFSRVFPVAYYRHIVSSICQRCITSESHNRTQRRFWDGHFDSCLSSPIWTKENPHQRGKKTDALTKRRDRQRINRSSKGEK